MRDAAMVRRVSAAQRTLDAHKRRKFKLGTNDCLRMVASHMRLLGYRVKLPPAGSYRSPATALRRLKERGYDSLGQALEAHGLKPIPWAAAIAGDVLQLKATHPLGGLVVVLGNGRAVGYHEDAPGAAVMQPTEAVAAWRVDPR